MDDRNSCDDNTDENDDLENYTKWAFLVCEQTNAWQISRVPPSCEVGDYEQDMCREGRDWRIAAFFDSSVENTLKAISILGGNSLDCNDNIAELLSGTCRSFLKAQDFLKEWSDQKRR